MSNGTVACTPSLLNIYKVLFPIAHTYQIIFELFMSVEEGG